MLQYTLRVVLFARSNVRPRAFPFDPIERYASVAEQGHGGGLFGHALIPRGFLAHSLSLTSFRTMTLDQSDPSMSPTSSMSRTTMAPERFALVKMVPVRLHCPMLALVRSAPVKSASVRAEDVTPARLLLVKLARLREPLV